MDSVRLAAACALALASWSAPAWAQDPPKAIGQVKTASGAASVDHGHGEGAQPLHPGDPLFQSDTVSTGGDGALGMIFIDNSMMSLGANGTLALDRFSFDAVTHKGAFESSLKRGTLAVKSGQIVAQTPEAMKIKTPAAILGVRGTDFLVRADGGS